jgi:hypothetical protein
MTVLNDGICPMDYELFVGRYVNILTFQRKTLDLRDPEESCCKTASPQSLK